MDLPAGRVHLTVEPVSETVQPNRFWRMMESIGAAQLVSRRLSRTREEIDAEVEALRDESEDEIIHDPRSRRRAEHPQREKTRL